MAEIYHDATDRQKKVAYLSKPIDTKLELMFPVPVYHTHRKSELDSSEKKDIEDIIKEGTYPGSYHSFSNDSYIFDTRLKNLKEFIEQHLKKYIKQVINPKEELDFYITQSWLNVTKPGGFRQVHFHSNSIISGVFYIQTDVSQTISFFDPIAKIKSVIKIDQESTPWNSDIWTIDVTDNKLLLFPSWLDHGVEPNTNTKDVISLSFNVFMKGTLGPHLNELILK